MALSIPLAIGQEVFLTYIGLGLPISIPSLGNLINEGRIVMMSPSLRYQLIFPSIILSLITISFYVMGNSFADAADAQKPCIGGDGPCLTIKTQKRSWKQRMWW